MRINPSDISTSFSNIVSSIINENVTNLFMVECIVMLPNNTTITIAPEQITKVTIDQNFFVNYRDMVEMELDISLETYKELVRNRQNLRFNITIFNLVTSENMLSRTTKPIKYIGIIKDQEDPSLRAPEKAIDNTASDSGYVTKTLPVVIELIPETVYRVRKSKFNFILNNATMEETIMFIADTLGFSKIFFVPPDNKTRYTNVVVPPLLELSDVFNYLQEYNAYGVYNSGINYYVFNDILYVFPMFNNLKSTSQFNIYNAGDGAYAGANCFHRETTLGVDVVNTNQIIVTSNSQSVVENMGNSYIINTPNKFIDKAGVLSKDKIYTVDKNFLTNVILYDDIAAINKNALTQSYVKTDNLHQIYSALSSNSVFTIGFTWPHAQPFLVYPNSNVSFIFDGVKQLQKHSGWPYSIKYTITKTKTIDTKSFACYAECCVGLLTNL